MRFAALTVSAVLFMLVLSRAAAQSETKKAPEIETTTGDKNEAPAKSDEAEKKDENSTASSAPAPKEKKQPMATTKGCEPGCEVCHEDHCFSCSSSFQRINYICEEKGCADRKCLDCSADVCYKCIDGYAPDLDGYCSWIGPRGCDQENCKLCESTRIGCSECEPGYQLRGSDCVKKGCEDKNCLRCSKDGKECSRCAEGFQSRLGICSEFGCSDSNCIHCSPSGGSCYQCRDGFYSSRYETPCQECPDVNCLNCNGSQNSCLRCKSGYFVSRLANRQIGCAECTEATDHCKTCSRNGDECHSCLEGYYLEHGHCIACPENCATCKSPWFCDTCKVGYDLLGSAICQKGKNVALQSSGTESVRFPALLFFLAGFFHLLFAGFVL